MIFFDIPHSYHKLSRSSCSELMHIFRLVLCFLGIGVPRARLKKSSFFSWGNYEWDLVHGGRGGCDLLLYGQKFIVWVMESLRQRACEKRRTAVACWCPDERQKFKQHKVSISQNHMFFTGTLRVLCWTWCLTYVCLWLLMFIALKVTSPPANWVVMNWFWKKE